MTYSHPLDKPIVEERQIQGCKQMCLLHHLGFQPREIQRMMWWTKFQGFFFGEKQSIMTLPNDE